MRSVFPIRIDGTPIPQGSKSVTRRGHMYEANRNLKPWRDKCVVILRQRWDGLEPYDEPIRVNVTFHMPQPKRPKYPLPGVKPDLDKLQRALGDALTQSGLITDDSRITTWQTTKRYSHTPGITIWAITPDTGDQP